MITKLKTTFTKASSFSQLTMTLFALIFASLGTYFLLFSHASSALPGDINKDGIVDVKDLSLLLSSYGNLGSACATDPIYTCDLDGSGGVNIVDVSILLGEYGQTAPTDPTNPAPLHGLGGLPIPAGVNTHQSLPDGQAQATYPSSVDLTQWAPPVGDQGQVDSCTAWAIDHSLFGWYVNKNGYSGGLHAPMYTYAQIVKGDDEGTYPSDNFSIAESQGIDTEADYTQGDYNYTTQPTVAEKSNAGTYKITSDFTIFEGNQTGTTAQILLERQLASGSPAVVELPVYPEFDKAGLGSGSLVGTPIGSEVSRGNHVVAAFGYNAQGLLIENQWGIDWGHNGYTTLSWAFVNQYLEEADAIGGISVKTSMMAGTNPSIYGDLTAFQASNGQLFYYNSSTGQYVNTQQGMMAGTSPSISGNIIAFQSNIGTLYYYNTSTGQSINTNQGMMHGTSPSISDVEIAFQANIGTLYVYNTYNGSSTNTYLGMAPGTNPSVSGTQIAFQANTGTLYTSNGQPYQGTDTHLGMASGTSPSISEGSIAFQANTGELYTSAGVPYQGTDTHLGMMAGTSPSDSLGYIAFQANDGALWVTNGQPYTGTGTNQGMMAGTSPSIYSINQSYQIAFQANIGVLFIFN